MSVSFPRYVAYSTEEPTYPSVQENILIGKTLGNRYRVLREIGSGGMAWVYLAEDIRENELVAVKVLYPQFGEDLSYIQRFNREAKLASALTDPHIVRVLDYGADRDVYYLVMEYIEGQNLRDVLSTKGPYLWRDALEIIDQLATALEHAHPRGIVHRDIKPQNLMLTETGLLKVLDFGIARIPTLPSLTQSGFVGSPYYVSPEQAMGEEVDTRSDIYSSGIVLYELLSGKIPFDAKSPWSIISQHITNDPPPIRLPEGAIPDEVHLFLNRMIAKKPEDRFPNPTALRRAIAAVLAGQPIPDSALDTQPIAPFDKTDMADGLYQRALNAIEAEEWARAVDLLNQVLSLDPNHTEAFGMRTEAEQQTFLISLYNAATRAMNNELWEDAINNFSGIIELEPEYRDARELLEAARRNLEDENARQFVTTRYNEGIAHFEAARWRSAVEAFQEVQRLSPGFERVEQLLVEAERLNNPNVVQKLTYTIEQYVPVETWWRWVTVLIGVAAIAIAFLTFGTGNPAADGYADAKQHLKVLYEDAQQAIANGNPDHAILLLDQILNEDPDYADTADLKRELVSTLVPSSLAVANSSEGDRLAMDVDEAQASIDVGNWSEAIDTLSVLRATDPEYEQARIASLFCDAYVGRGLETLTNIGKKDQEETISTALADFEAGVTECPRRTDLQEQAERAAAYFDAINFRQTEYDALIHTLTPIVAADPEYAAGNAKNLLYTAHLKRGDSRREASDFVGALSDYESALALSVDDPSLAQNRRAELLLSFSRQDSLVQLSPQEIETSTYSVREEEGTVEKVTPEPVRIRFRSPELIGPEDDTLFAGKFSEVFVEWESIGRLAADEYYDLTIMHLFADEPTYWGLATKETRVQLSSDIGVSRAGGDRFYWWVTVRKANSAPTPNSIDLPVSRQSEVRTFIWSP